MTVLVERVEFHRVSTGGVVHVLDRYEPVEGLPPLYARQVARCGRFGRPGVHDLVGRFPDRELCARCWQHTPAERRSELFTHPQDDDA